MNCMPTDAKHSIFLSDQRGSIGVRSFTCEYMRALLRDIEVYISNERSLTVHALLYSIEEASKKCIWNLHRDGKFPTCSNAAAQENHIVISGKKNIILL
jgi:hypothetical protein